MTEHKIIFGDSRSLNLINGESVHLIVTSPPYWQLIDYGSNDQIGFNDNYEEYINNLNLVWQECFRILKSGCRLCINIGDQFARSVYYGRYKVIPIRTEIIHFCECLGMVYDGSIIWQKTTTMNTSGGGAVMGSYPYPRNGILKIDYEFILIFSKQGDAPEPTQGQKESSILSDDEMTQYFSSHWNFSGVKQTEHLAMFPEELPKRLIKMFSYTGETVFDPFVGSGTTSLAAIHLGRNSIGYELNKEFKPVIEKKLTTDPLSSIDNFTITFLKDDGHVNNTYDKLPYIFKDPHKIDKKVDVKKLQFGSKIDNKKQQNNELFIVKDVIAANKIILNNGNIIKLLGIEVIPEFEKEVIDYLKTKFNKRKVYLKYDDKVKYDNEGTPCCYVYLDNRTFINNHLIRTGYVDVNTVDDYKNKNKFIKTKMTQESLKQKQIY